MITDSLFQLYDPIQLQVTPYFNYNSPFLSPLFSLLCSFTSTAVLSNILKMPVHISAIAGIMQNAQLKRLLNNNFYSPGSRYTSKNSRKILRQMLIHFLCFQIHLIFSSMQNNLHYNRIRYSLHIYIHAHICMLFARIDL